MKNSVSDSDLPFRLTKTDVAAVSASVNRQLLHCVALIELNPTRPPKVLAQALAVADEALATAVTFRRYELMPRAQLHRGHCLRGLGRWREAHEAYVRAAGHGRLSMEVGRLTRECMERVVKEEVQRARAEAFERGVRKARMEALEEEIRKTRVETFGARETAIKQKERGRSRQRAEDLPSGLPNLKIDGSTDGVSDSWCGDTTDDGVDAESFDGEPEEVYEEPYEKVYRASYETLSLKSYETLCKGAFEGPEDEAKRRMFSGTTNSSRSELVLLRDGRGRIVRIQTSVPDLRSVKGLRFSRSTSPASFAS
jgi:hypothetical protein